MQNEFNHYFNKAREESHRNPLYMPIYGPYRPEPVERYNGGGDTPPLELSDDDGDDMFGDDEPPPKTIQEPSRNNNKVMINHVYAPSYRLLFDDNRGNVPRLLRIGDTCDSKKVGVKYMPEYSVRQNIVRKYIDKLYKREALLQENRVRTAKEKILYLTNRAKQFLGEKGTVGLYLIKFIHTFNNIKRFKGFLVSHLKYPTGIEELNYMYDTETGYETRNFHLFKMFRRALRSFQELLYDEFYPASKAFLPSRIRHVEDVIWIGDDLFTGYSSYLYYWEYKKDDKRFVLKCKEISEYINSSMLDVIAYSMNLLKQNISYISRNHINDEDHRNLYDVWYEIHENLNNMNIKRRIDNQRYNTNFQHRGHNNNDNNMKKKRRIDNRGHNNNFQHRGDNQGGVRNSKRRRHHIYENQELKF